MRSPVAGGKRRHACKFGLEGIVSKRKDSPYRSGRSPDWLKMKDADAPGLSKPNICAEPTHRQA